MVLQIPLLKDPMFKRNVIRTVIEMCTLNNYENIKDFEWLVHNVVFIIAKQKDIQFDRPLSRILIEIS